MTKLATSVLVGAGLIAGGCYVETGPPRRPMPPPPEPGLEMTPASAPAVSIETAVALLSEARCDREARCNNIGPRARYATFDHCRGVEHDQIQMRFEACRYGVHERELSVCVEDTRYYACGVMGRQWEWHRQIPSCSPQNLCVR